MNEQQLEDATPVVKKCTYCQLDKNLDNFNNSTNGKYGKTSRCKECIKTINKDYSRTYYQRNKSKLLQKQKQYNETNKDRIKEYHKKYYNLQKKDIEFINK